MGSRPLRQLGGAGGWRRDAQEVPHETFDLWFGHDDIANKSAHQGADRVGEDGRHRNDGARFSDSLSDGANEFPVGEALWSDRIDGYVFMHVALCHGKRGEVIDIDGLKAVVAPPEHAEDRQVSKEPRDVVDEDVLVAEENRRTENGIGQPGLFQGAFKDRLA